MEHALRKISFRSHGVKRGPITRLISPSPEGQLTKPFVFLDYFDLKPPFGKGFGPHPHSGIATLTTFLEGNIVYGDSTGTQGEMISGSVEWIKAGKGVWHWGRPKFADSVSRGYQLWLALPESQELSEPESQYFSPTEVQNDGRVQVLLGTYQGLRSPVAYPEPPTYLLVKLKDGESWTYFPDRAHEMTWLAVETGQLKCNDELVENEIVVFENGNGQISIVSKGDSEFVIASSKTHPHELVTGYSSVHTTAHALKSGEETIQQISNSPSVKKAIADYAQQ